MEEKRLIGSGKCTFCGKDNRVEVPESQMAGYDKWLGGMSIQDAMPGLSAGKREVLMTGICLTCHRTVFVPREDNFELPNISEVSDSDSETLSGELSNLGYEVELGEDWLVQYNSNLSRRCIKIDTNLNTAIKFDWDFEICEFNEEEATILNKYNIDIVPVKYTEDDLPF